VPNIEPQTISKKLMSGIINEPIRTKNKMVILNPTYTIIYLKYYDVV